MNKIPDCRVLRPESTDTTHDWLAPEAFELFHFQKKVETSRFSKFYLYVLARFSKCQNVAYVTTS